jgi:tellurite resistance protein
MKEKYFLYVGEREIKFTNKRDFLQALLMYTHMQSKTNVRVKEKVMWQKKDVTQHISLPRSM